MPIRSLVLGVTGGQSSARDDRSARGVADGCYGALNLVERGGALGANLPCQGRCVFREDRSRGWGGAWVQYHEASRGSFTDRPCAARGNRFHCHGERRLTLTGTSCPAMLLALPCYLDVISVPGSRHSLPLWRTPGRNKRLGGRTAPRPNQRGGATPLPATRQRSVPLTTGLAPMEEAVSQSRKVA